MSSSVNEHDPEHIWLICGYAGSGKDTAAGILAKNLARTSISSFASAVKERLNPPANTTHWILSDWRFLAELDCFRERFPASHIHTIRVVRNGVVPLETDTEHELDGFPCDVVLDNSSSRISLGNQIESKIHGVLEREMFL